MAPGILWMAALLAVLLSLDSLFRADLDDGSLEQWLMSPHPLPMLVPAKLAAYWLCSGLELAVLAPHLALILDLPAGCLPVLLALLLLAPQVVARAACWDRVCQSL